VAESAVWPRVYSSGMNPDAVAIGLAVAGLALVAVLMTVRDEHPVVIALAGLVPAMLLVGAAVVHRWGTTRAITCDPGGFRVTTRSRRQGTHEVAHGWADVTATRCWTDTSADHEGNLRSHTYFSIDVDGEEVLTVVSARDRHAAGAVRVRDFAGLVSTVSETTPHLGYGWAPTRHGRGFTKTTVP
jgi:hypothetical protein